MLAFIEASDLELAQQVNAELAKRIADVTVSIDRYESLDRLMHCLVFARGPQRHVVERPQAFTTADAESIVSAAQRWAQRIDGTPARERWVDDPDDADGGVPEIIEMP